MKRMGSIEAKIYLALAVSLVVGAALGYWIADIAGIHASLVPLISAIVGLLVALSVPLWQVFFVNAPKLSVEINAIKRTVSDAAVITLNDDPELRVLVTPQRINPYIYIDDLDIPGRRVNTDGRYTLSEVENVLNATKQRLRDLPSQIEERKKDVDRLQSFTPATLTKYETDRLNQPLSPEVDWEPTQPEKTLDALRVAYQKRLDDLEKRYIDIQTNLPLAERKVELLRTSLVDNRSFFTVSASLINSGRSNTAIKVPALLRVSIGEGNYIDLKLTLKDFENKSEITASGTRIVIFESPEVSSLPEEDRKLIGTYWGQSVSSRLYLEDIHSRIYSSNTIAFAEGLYQKIIYDRLGRAASYESK